MIPGSQTAGCAEKLTPSPKSSPIKGEDFIRQGRGLHAPPRCSRPHDPERHAPNLTIAEMWKDVLEGEGLPTKILPEEDILQWGERVPFRIMVPRGREHVADEILRKL